MTRYPDVAGLRSHLACRQFPKVPAWLEARSRRITQQRADPTMPSPAPHLTDYVGMQGRGAPLLPALCGAQGLRCCRSVVQRLRPPPPTARMIHEPCITPPGKDDFMIAGDSVPAAGAAHCGATHMLHRRPRTVTCEVKFTSVARPI